MYTLGRLVRFAFIVVGTVVIVAALVFVGIGIYGSVQAQQAIADAKLGLSEASATPTPIVLPTPRPTAVAQAPMPKTKTWGFESDVANTATATATVTQTQTEVKLVEDRGNPQVPDTCSKEERDVNGLCPLNVEVPAAGFTIVGGAPMSGFGNAILLDAGAGDYQYWLYVNNTGKTQNLDMRAYKASNYTQSWHFSGPVGKATLDATAFAKLVEIAKGALNTGNCTDHGCTPNRVGYLTFQVTGIDSADRQYYFNPTQDATGTVPMPPHAEFLASLGLK